MASPADPVIPPTIAPKRIAVIGSGLAGLTVAHLLSLTKLTVTTRRRSSPTTNEEDLVVEEWPAFEVHLYERNPTMGMDAASIPVPCACVKCAGEAGVVGARHVEARMDVPMRSFFPEYYPILTGIYDSIGVEYQGSDNSMSFLNLDRVISSPADAFRLPTAFPSRLPSPTTPPTPPLTPTPTPGKLQHEASPSTTPRARTYFSFSCLPLPSPLPNLISYPDVFPFPAPATHPAPPLLPRLARTAAVVGSYLRLLVQSKRLLASGAIASARRWRRGLPRHGRLDGVGLGEFFRGEGYAEAFWRDTFWPLFSGVCTCSFETLEGFPAWVVLEYVATCMPFGTMSFVSNGIDGVCRRLSAPFKDRVRCGRGVDRVVPLPDGGFQLAMEGDQDATTPPGSPGPNTAAAAEGPFDHVVFATQANQCARVLRRSFHGKGGVDAVAGVLDRFAYERSLVVCHTDAGLMPVDRGAWRCLNFARLDPDAVEGTRKKGGEGERRWGYDPADVAQCTHYAEMTQGTLKGMAVEPRRGKDGEEENGDGVLNLFQTTNPVVMPREDKVLSAAWFERCVVTQASVEAVTDLDRWQGMRWRSGDEAAVPRGEGGSEDGSRGGMWFVGSYASHGIPLLEGCVTSAARVTKRLCEELKREIETRVGTEVGEGRVWVKVEVVPHAPWKDGLEAEGVEVEVGTKKDEVEQQWRWWWVAMVWAVSVAVAALLLGLGGRGSVVA
ncbi:hypothetical protein HDU96_007538 [Phlyctochytrium bullatum]|nr:hypothetical protein HDU96_007538 [Phlyctochytrium bullatum]